MSSNNKCKRKSTATYATHGPLTLFYTSGRGLTHQTHTQSPDEKKKKRKWDFPGVVPVLAAGLAESRQDGCAPWRPRTLDRRVGSFLDAPTRPRQENTVAAPTRGRIVLCHSPSMSPTSLGSLLSTLVPSPKDKSRQDDQRRQETSGDQTTEDERHSPTACFPALSSPLRARPRPSNRLIPGWHAPSLGVSPPSPPIGRADTPPVRLSDRWGFFYTSCAHKTKGKMFRRE